MAKLYNKKGKVHPSPPSVADQLALLPAAILTLAAALAPGDREVLAYLISCSNHTTSRRGVGSDGRKNGEHEFPGEGDHPPMFQCGCFRCYKSFWSRWDASPNRQAIHEIIDAYEDGLFRSRGKGSNAKKKKQRKGRNRVADCGDDRATAERTATAEDESGEQGIGGGGGDDEAEAAAAAAGGGAGDGEAGSERGAVRKIASFIGERIWGAWNRENGERSIFCS
ncbi:uncharacterized protein LOC115680612 isoform X1 [Syzygium oleosum]|uniref:uncharacterized protein LOC115680612 isoform X1 n=1 Tax=Syzygium oleosum TaxID=219896 RepID=UPI0024B8E9B8|nr:uncharacterized protein LOC115680612 isoform X1 [Syzygium oleosum]